ncbi:hypothetical protein SARC_11388, partial [Sphaeroforma arctica JP610]
ASGPVVAGVAVAVGAYGLSTSLKLITRYSPVVAQKWDQLQKSNFARSYYKGGFEPEMNRREAGLVLGVSPSSDIKRVRDAHRRIMLANHPDRGGSPFLASKINEAKELFEKNA